MHFKLGQFALLPLLSVLLFQSHLMLLLAPAPLLYAFFKYGRASGLGISLASIVLYQIMTSPISIWFFVMLSPLLAVIFYELSSKLKHLEKSFLMTMGLLFLSSVSFLLFASNGQPYTFLFQNISGVLKSLPEQLTALKMTSVQAKEWQVQLSHLAQNADTLTHTFLKEQFLGYFFGGLLAVLWLNTAVLTSFGLRPFKAKLSRWKSPEAMIWVFIVTFFFTLVPSAVLTPISKNISSVLLLIYFLQGMAIATFFIQKRKVGTFSKIVFYSMLTIFPFVTICLGFSDLWINFRDRTKKKKKETSYESHFKRRS